MKHSIFRLIFLFSTLVIYGQSIERQVIGSSGNSITDGNIVMEFTVGELVTQTITDGTTTLNQGFHQKIALQVKVNPIVFLQGASLNPIAGEETLMRDDLRALNLIPTTSPYSDGLTCSVSVFNVTGDNAIVDWVWVELRDPSVSMYIIEGQSALLQRDGDIVAVDGTSEIIFNYALNNYHIAVKHRNHLGIVTNNAVAYNGTVAQIDLTEANSTITFGNNAQSTFGLPTDKVGMWAGNVNGDVELRYQGSDNDTNTIKDAVLAETGNTSNSNLYSYSGYSNADVNMDGIIRYQGSDNDTNTIKDIILSHPDNLASPSNLFIATEQLPENE